MRRAILPMLFAWTFVNWAPAETLASTRVALVLGNSAYEHTRELPNPTNDAAAIAETLKGLGFDSVTLKLNQGYSGMRESIRAFGRVARSADVALVYYAGHGLELGRQNYLVPVDAKLETDDDLRFEAVTLDDVLYSVRRAGKLRLVILDACRNNPLSSAMDLAGGVTRSVSRGFARIEPTGDVLVAYAAKHGTVAEDGDGRHSPYAAALLKHLPTPGLDVGFLFRRVRSAVLDTTSRRQEPFTYGSLGDENVYLVPPSSTKDAIPRPALPAATSSAAAEAWNVVQDSMAKEDLEAFVAAFPGSFYAKLAANRLNKLDGATIAATTPSNGTDMQDDSRRHSTDKESKKVANEPFLTRLAAYSDIRDISSDVKHVEEWSHPQEFVVWRDRASVRSGPDASFPQIKRLDNQAKIRIIGKLSIHSNTSRTTPARWFIAKIGQKTIGFISSNAIASQKFLPEIEGATAVKKSWQELRGRIEHENSGTYARYAGEFIRSFMKDDGYSYIIWFRNSTAYLTTDASPFQKKYRISTWGMGLLQLNTTDIRNINSSVSTRIWDWPSTSE